MKINFEDYTYRLENDVFTETGIYSVVKFGTYDVIQFRSDSEASVLTEAYTMGFGTKVITETVKRQTVEKTVTDYDNITLSPVKITSTDCFAAEGRSYVLSRAVVE